MLFVLCVLCASAMARSPDPTVAELRAQRDAAMADLKALAEARLELELLEQKVRSLRPIDLGPDPLAGTPAAEPDPCPGVERERTQSTPAPWAEGITVVRRQMVLRGRIGPVVCAARALATRGGLVEISSLSLKTTKMDATAVVDALEWQVGPLPKAEPRPRTPTPSIAADASPEAQVLARELELLRGKQDDLARTRARQAVFEARLRALEVLSARLATSQWHAQVLRAVGERPVIELGLELSPGAGRVTGEEYETDSGALLKRIDAPVGVAWDASGLRPPRQQTVTLPVVLDAGADVRLDAYDAPAHGLAVLLGESLISGPRSAPRFTGRISAASMSSARAALNGAVPGLSGLERVSGSGDGEKVNIRIVDARGADLVQLLARISGRSVKGCAIEHPVTVSVREAPVGAVIDAVEAIFAAEPRCAGTPTAPTPYDDAPPPFEIGEDWRLVATLIRGPHDRTGVFVDGDGAMRLAADGFGGADVLHLEPGKVVSSNGQVYLLGAKER